MPATDDEMLIDRLRRVAAEVDPTPDTVFAAARAAIETRDLDARLAWLVVDSAEAGTGLEAVRGQDPPGGAEERLLLYDGGGVQVDLAVRAESGTLSVVGRLAGAVLDSAALERSGGRTEPLELDELGRFSAARLPSGPLRLRCRARSGDPVVTTWVNL